MPFQIEGNVNTGTYNHEIAYSNGYVFIANGANGVRAYIFDGENFTLAGARDDGGTYLGVHVLWPYVFCGGIDFVRVYTFNGATFVPVASNATRTYKLKARREGGNTYVYTARANAGLSVYQLIGGALNLIDTIDAGAAPYIDGLSIDDTYIYGATQLGGVRAYSFDGVNLNYINNYLPVDGVDIQDIESGNASNIFVSTFTNHIHRLRFNGAAFVLRSDYDLSPYGADRIFLYDGMLYAQVAPLATHAQTWVYALDSRQGEDLVLVDNIEIPTIGAFTSEDMHFGGGFAYCAKSYVVYALSLFRYALRADFDWTPKNRKGPITVQFIDRSSIGYE